MTAPAIVAGACAVLLALGGPAFAQERPPGDVAPPAAETAAIVFDDSGQVPAVPPAPVAETPAAPVTTRSGLEIYRNFRAGLADPVCEPGASTRWRQHFAHAPGLLASPRSDVLPLFGYVVDQLRAANLPTEYALIPFVESGYKPGARSSQGPAGLWQFIALTARNHKVAVRPGYDGRLSPVDSTEAAVRYLKTLHGMFAGDWRLAVMAYNAGEYRLLSALRRAGQRPATADPESLPMPSITMAYVRKLHALSCLFEEVEDRDAWLQSLDRQVPLLVAAEAPARIATLQAYASRQAADAEQLRRLNPVFANGRIPETGKRARLLVPAAYAPIDVAATAHNTSIAALDLPATAAPDAAPREDISDAMADASAHATAPRTHTVARGDSIWTIAKRYAIRSGDLLTRNGLDGASVLKPGMVLAIDPLAPPSAAGGMAE